MEDSLYFDLFELHYFLRTKVILHLLFDVYVARTQKSDFVCFPADIFERV